MLFQYYLYPAIRGGVTHIHSTYDRKTAISEHDVLLYNRTRFLPEELLRLTTLFTEHNIDYTITDVGCFIIETHGKKLSYDFWEVLTKDYGNEYIISVIESHDDESNTTYSLVKFKTSHFFNKLKDEISSHFKT